MQFRKNSVFIICLLLAGFILSLITYVPDVIENTSIYKFLRIIEYLLFGALFFLTLNARHIVYVRIILVYFVILIFFLIETLVFSSIGLNMDFSELLQIFIPFIIILIGFNTNISSKTYISFLIIYCITASAVSVYSVIYYIGSFTVLDQATVTYKNEIGAILSNSIAIILCLILMNDKRKLKKIYLICFGIIMLVCLFVFKARAAFIGLMVSILVLIWVFLKQKKYGYLIIGIVILSSFILYLYINFKIPAFLESFFLGGNDPSNLNSISTNRIDRNSEALKFISENPVLGQLTTSFQLAWVHNYLLLKVSQYGLLGSFPLICLYFYLIWTIIKKTSKIRELGTEHFGYIVMIIPLTISLFEPSFPYGPGTVQVIVYFMIGYSLKNSVHKSSDLINHSIS